MFYLKKCKNCDRSGSVALEEGDELCNLCKEAKPAKGGKKEGEE